MSRSCEIVLTHFHADHTGSAANLERRSGAGLLAHRDEVPYIEQTKTQPFTSPVYRLLNKIVDRLLPKSMPFKINGVLEDGCGC